MTNRVNLKPIDSLGVSGLNVLILSGNIPLFSDNPLITINVTLVKDIDAAAQNAAMQNNNGVPDNNGSFNGSYSIKKSNLSDISEETIKREVLNRMGLVEATPSISVVTENTQPS